MFAVCDPLFVAPLGPWICINHTWRKSVETMHFGKRWKKNSFSIAIIIWKWNFGIKFHFSFWTVNGRRSWKGWTIPRKVFFLAAPKTRFVRGAYLFWNIFLILVFPLRPSFCANHSDFSRGLNQTNILCKGIPAKIPLCLSLGTLYRNLLSDPFK